MGRNDKGKGKVDTSKWNEWQWNDETQTEYRSRQKSSGLWEYEHRRQAAIPRTKPKLPDGFQHFEGDYNDNDNDNEFTTANPESSNKNFDNEDYQDIDDDDSHYDLSNPPPMLNDFQKQRVASPMAIPGSVNSYANNPILSASAPGYGSSGYNLRGLASHNYPSLEGFRTSANAPMTHDNSHHNTEVDEIGTRLATSSIDGGRGPFSQTARPSSTSPPRRDGQYSSPESPFKERQDELNPEIKIRPARQFIHGKIIKTLWTEPRGSSISNEEGGLTEVVRKTPADYGEVAYTSIRRFAIIRVFKGHCIGLPISTYSFRGTTKKGLQANDHAIIYVHNKKKPSIPKLLKGESNLPKKPIRMDPLNSRHQLDPSSRINFAKLYTIEYNTKVEFIGRIHKESMNNFVKYYNQYHPSLPEEGDVPDISEETEENEGQAGYSSQGSFR